jgi:glycosyltransferase involved in cell wall biosynthesis
MGIGVVLVVDTVAVGMITRDSIRQRGVGVLSLVLRRLLSEVPNVTRIIISDASRDGTLRFIAGYAARHGVEVLPIADNVGSRAFARSQVVNAFLGLTSDSYLLFLDDDAVLRRGWWVETVNLLNSGCHAVWGVNWDYHPGRMRVLAQLGLNPLDFYIEAFKRRGGTHDLLLTRDAVVKLARHLPIPTWLRIYEDAFIKNALETEGIRVCINKTGIIHMSMNSSGGYLGNIIDAGARALARARVITAARRIYGIDEYGIYRDAELTPNLHDPYHLLYAILLKIYSWLITL